MIKKLRKMIGFNIALIICNIMLSGCSVWQDEFDEPVQRAMPKASIHKISTMVDKGIIKESDVDDFAGLGAGSTNYKVFKDGAVSRGMEEVKRIYLLSYEDSDKTFHSAHHLYVVVQPAQWFVPQTMDTQSGNQK